MGCCDKLKGQNTDLYSRSCCLPVEQGDTLKVMGKSWEGDIMLKIIIRGIIVEVVKSISVLTADKVPQQRVGSSTIWEGVACTVFNPCESNVQTKH